MPAESLAGGPAPSTVDGLNTEEAGALGTTITGEEVWSGGAARRATTQETLTVLGQGDSVSSILIRSPQVRAYDGRAAGHRAHQWGPVRISALH
jgi:hypothetical protein